MPNLWAIVCGLIRDEAAALRKVEALKTLRRDGVLQGVVFSAWFGNYEAHAAVNRAVAEAGFVFVESHEPKLKLRGHAFHQSKSIHMALQFVPDDALVLRLRPDLAELTPDFVKFLTAVHRGDIKAARPAAPVYDCAVFINSCFLGCPFYINDIILLASKPHLKRIFHFDYGFEFFGSNLAPEQFFFLRAFADQFPIFDAFSRVNTGLLFERPDDTKRLVRAQLDSDFFMDVLALYWVLLGDTFDVGFVIEARRDAARIEAETRRRSLFDLLTMPDGVLGLIRHTGANTTVCMRDDTLHVLLEGKMLRDRDAERLTDAIGRVRRWLSGAEPWPVRASAGIDDYVAAVSAVIPLNTGLPKRVTETRFGLWGYDRPEIVGGDETYERMAGELNVLRRAVDELRGKPRL
jgi:hypothetical protein